MYLIFISVIENTETSSSNDWLGKSDSTIPVRTAIKAEQNNDNNNNITYYYFYKETVWNPQRTNKAGKND